MLKIRERKSMPKKILIYGLDGSGKSTFAEKFCRENGLRPVCVDIDDTNFTSVPCIEFERTNHIKVKEQIIDFIHDVTDSEEYDTIIIDGISSLLNLLVSNGKGLSKYGDRTSALNKILNELVKSRQNVIFIGQIDLETLDESSSVAVVNINSIVNEKYKCVYDGKRYTQQVKKFRRLQEVEASIPKKVSSEEVFEDPTEIVSEPKKLDNFYEIAQSIVAELPRRHITPAKVELMKLVQKGIISDEDCPKVLAELERLL